MEVSVIATLDKLDRLQSFWEIAQVHPNADLEHFRLVCEMRPEVIRPHVVVVGAPEQPSALLVCRLEHYQFVPSIGYLRPVKVNGRVLTGLYRGLIGDASEAQATLLIQHLLAFLRAGEADAVYLHHVADTSVLMSAFLSSAPRLWSQKKAVSSEHWTFDLPKQVGEFTQRMRSKRRAWLRRKERELDTQFAGTVVWTWNRSFESIPKLCAELETVACRTYQRGLGAGFHNDEEHRKRFELCASRDQLRLQLLHLNGELQAFWVGVVYKGTFYSWATAYNADIREYEPGNLLFQRMVDELVREGVEKFDFGLGDAFYKQRFGDHSWRETTVRLFAPNAKGMLLRGSLGLSAAVDRIGRRCLEMAGLTGKIKGAWRRRIARQPS
jgi:hypothetical protein